MKNIFVLSVVFATLFTTLISKDKTIMGGKVVESNNIVIIERLDGSELIQYGNNSEWYLNKASTREKKLPIPPYVKNRPEPILYEDTKGVEYISYDNAKTWIKYTSTPNLVASTEENIVKREYKVELKENQENIFLYGILGSEEVSIVDLFGKVILQTSGTINIDVKHLITGTYFVIIKDGINSYSSKISITR